MPPAKMSPTTKNPSHIYTFVVQYKCRAVYDLTSKENRDRALPQGVTLTEA